MPLKPNRAVYRLWHNESDRGRTGYVGKDSHWPRRGNLTKRAECKGCPKLYFAFQKYPIAMWFVEVLASGFRSLAALNRAEKRFIKKFNSRIYGYNITIGGDGGPGWKKGRKLSSATKLKLSLINRGKNNPKWGMKDSLKTRSKKRAAAQGNKANSGRRFSKSHKSGIGAAQQSAWSRYTSEERISRGLAMRLGWKKRLAHLKRRPR